MREAPSLVLAARLQAEGAEVRAWDPLVTGHPELDGVASSPRSSTRCGMRTRR